MRTLLALVTTILLAVGCASHPAPQAHTAVRAPREAVAVLAQLERDLAVLRYARAAAQNNPAEFRHASSAVDNSLRNANVAMTVAARATAPPLKVSYPAQYQAALSQRNARAMALARQQYGEKETAVAYAFEQAHAGQRLDLRLRLQTLHLDAQSRHKAQAELNALDGQERAAVAAQRATDDAALAAYANTLNVGSNAAVASMAAEVRAHPATRNAAAVTPVNLGQAVQVANAANRDIQSRFTSLAQKDASAMHDLDEEIALLSAECDRLRAEIANTRPGENHAEAHPR